MDLCEQWRPVSELTMSSALLKEHAANVTVFSLGANTEISPEAYDRSMIYLTLWGGGRFLTAEETAVAEAGDLYMVQKQKAVSMRTVKGWIYLEINGKEALQMIPQLQGGGVVSLKELVPYKEGAIVNRDVASNDGMKFVLMAFDKGEALSPHRAPSEALLVVLEGKARVQYEGETHALGAGQTILFEKDGLHAVEAEEKMKMALILIKNKADL